VTANGAVRTGKTKVPDDGSMTLLEHLRELQKRLFRASLGVAVGFGIGLWLRTWVLDILQKPYCDVAFKLASKHNKNLDPATFACQFVQLAPGDYFVLQMKVALWVGLIVAAPWWLYQLWAFIAPGLHKHERKWAYWFTGLAAPLFALGAVLAYVVISKGLYFLLTFGTGGSNIQTTLEITKYISFITGMLLIFGVAFEFPLVILLLNFSGMVSGRKMLGWWRVAVFLFFAFAAVATPTPDPFGMSLFALALSALYFAAVGAAMINDRRKRLRDPNRNLRDDEIEEIDAPDAIDEPEAVDGPEEIEEPEPIPAVGRYDEMT
jgi:sec-independent protein translocase protein TatC